MYTVRQLLQSKGGTVWTISPQTSVYEALQMMAEKNIGALLVVQTSKLVGLFSERDYARKVILQGRSSKTTTVGELMTREVLYISPDDSIEDCMALMTAKRNRHLPVIENDKLIGIISIGDVVKEIIRDREFTIQQLERYITGGFAA